MSTGNHNRIYEKTMNEKLDFIFSRRSIRQFTEEPVSDSQIEAILQAGMPAPSARARDPWRFVVTRRSADLEMMRTSEPVLEPATCW